MHTQSKPSNYPKRKLTIVGAGITGILQALFAHLDAKLNGEQIRVTLQTKNKELLDTIVGHIKPSFTPDEMLAVIPFGKEFIEKLKLSFKEAGLNPELAGVLESAVAQEFIEAVLKCGDDEEGNRERTRVLLELTTQSMKLWQNLSERNPELKKIFEQSNYHPCREVESSSDLLLNHGYRIDVLYNLKNAEEKAKRMIETYDALGYKRCKSLTREEAITLDPCLASVFETYPDAAAVLRPGGCLNTQAWLPLIYEYLRKEMGTYVNENGEEKDCFQMRFDRQVDEIACENNHIVGLRFWNKTEFKKDKHKYEESNYALAPGESTGTIKKWGFVEPVSARFAGPSLMFEAALLPEELEKYKSLNHCMEVHQNGVVLAWQAECRDGKLMIGLSGTKAFYGDQVPKISDDEPFAKNRHELQFNMLNDFYPEIVSRLLNKDTKGKAVTRKDLDDLVKGDVIKLWVGNRAASFNGFMTVGNVYKKNETTGNNERIINAWMGTNHGSGGNAAGPISVVMSRSSFYGSSNRLNSEFKVDSKLIEEGLKYGSALCKP